MAIKAGKAIEAEGQAALDRVGDKAGEFVWGDGEGYVWVHDSDGLMVKHPMKPQLDGKGLMEMKDSNGTYLFVNMTEIALEKGAGWVGYVWPKPGAEASSPKMSYVVKAVNGNKTYIVGSGIYDVTIDDIKKQFPGDAIYQE